ncbi:helix-turn-helix transcriptional regulator [Pseudoalteromonas xiamenensis]|uniref:helix-turn-helix domain-containing protein n=1 Tax=Pseudoalteromonas xiamenensis TaxID=882626 RepID=UPI0027E41660|nr:helix-turn-helix transcriptional regulator [Pseudoalteromonas xiamenensis]WMN61367.1 helix-turn-helix transcriptional regulator [Pseudoalteromonas xiamenensis]
MQTPEEYEITLRVNALVKGLKKRRGYTKKDISQKLGIGLTTFNDYLNGVSSFKLGTLIQFAALCKLTLPDILEDTLEAKKLYSEELADKANAGKNTLDFLAFILLVPAITNAHGTQYLFCFLQILLLFFARKDLNSMTMSLVFLVVYVFGDLLIYPIEAYIFPYFNGLVQNAVAFGANIVIDVLLIVLLKNRTLLSLWFSQGRNKLVLEKNFIEGPIYAVAIGFLLVDGLAFFENIIRNLEHFGIDESFAKHFWKITYIYDYFEYLKSSLMAIGVILLFIGTRIRQRQLDFAVV